MRGSIEPIVSKLTGRRAYKPRVYLGRREAAAAGLTPGWKYNGTYERLRRHATEPSAEAALEELQDRLRRLVAGERPQAPGSTDTVRAAYERWMRDQVRPNERANTVRSYERAFEDHVLGVVVRVDSAPVRIGDLPAAELTSADVAEWQAAQLTGGRLDGRPGGCAVKSVRNYRGSLHLLYAWLRSVMGAEFGVNPVEGVPAPHWNRRIPTPPTIDVAQQYIDALRGTRSEVRVSEKGKRYGVRFEQSRYWPALVITAFTGERRGEALAERWSDFSWRAEQSPDGGTHLVGGLRVDPLRGNLTGRTAKTLRFGPPKTDAGGRFVPLPEEAVAALVELRAERMRSLPPGADWDEQALICCGRSGQPIVPDNLTHGLSRTLQRRGLPPLHLHQLRHMVATEMRRQGVDRDVLARYLGHADPATTSGYDHVSEDDQRTAAEAFSRRWREVQDERARTATKPVDNVVPLRSRA